MGRRLHNRQLLSMLWRRRLYILRLVLLLLLLLLLLLPSLSCACEKRCAGSCTGGCTGGCTWQRAICLWLWFSRPLLRCVTG